MVYHAEQPVASSTALECGQAISPFLAKMRAIGLFEK
jgi:hypothetical protein